MRDGLTTLPPEAKDAILRMRGSEEVLKLFIRMIELHAAKQSDYVGDHDDPFFNFRMTARLKGCSIRDVMEVNRFQKHSRLVALTPERQAQNEPRVDSLMDQAMYLLLEAGCEATIGAEIDRVQEL